MRPGASRASIWAPALCARISGNAPATTTWSATWPRRSTSFSSEGRLRMMMLVTIGVLLLAIGGGYYAFAGGGDISSKRIDAIAKPQASGRSTKAPVDALKRKNVQQMLKE